MAYFEPYVNADGIHVPSYDDVLDFLKAQYKSIFGEDVYLGEETPDYQLLSVFAKCIDDFSSLAIESYNARNPQYASGDSLDLLVQFNGMTRKSATASTVVLTVSGTTGTVIPSGSKAIDEQGNVWVLDSSVTITGEDGNSVNATCETLGEIISPSGTISSIFTPIPGWESVTNAEAGTGGTNIETDAELRERFSLAHAITKSGITDSFVAGLLNIQGVKFVSMNENNTDTDNTGSGGLPPHSFCAVVDGGDNTEVAEMIFSLKAPGVATYGSTTVAVVDAYGNSNDVKFSRPTETTVSVTINITPLTGYTPGTDEATRINEQIKSGILADINALGIAKPWNVSMGFKDVYSLFDSRNMPFTITSITATGAENGIVPCSYDHVLVTDPEHIFIVLPQ